MRKFSMVLLIFMLLIFALPLVRVPTLSAQEGNPDPPDPLDRSVDLIFTVDPSGRVAIKGAVNDTTVTTSLLFEEDLTLYEAFSLIGNNLATNLTVLLPPERAAEFPFNATTFSLLTEYAEGPLDTGFSFTLVFPENMSQYLPPDGGDIFDMLLNNTDFTLEEEYSNGDVVENVYCTITANLTDLLEKMLGLPISFEAPFTLDLNYLKGEYNGALRLYLLPGLPIGDVEIDITGNLTEVLFNGTVSVIYGIYDGMEINSTVLDMIVSYAETNFTAPIDTEGSLLNMTQGELNCTHIDIQRESTNGGEMVTFEVGIHGDFVGMLMYPLYSMPEEERPSELEITWLYVALNKTLHKFQDVNLQLVYTPTDTKLDFTLTGTMHIRDLVEQILEPIVIPEEWLPDLPEGFPLIINSTHLPHVWTAFSILNATIYSLESASLHLAYTHEDRILEINHTSLLVSDGLEEDLIKILSELPPEIEELLTLPPNMTQVIASLLAKRLVNITSAQASLTYANGKLSFMDVQTLEGDINAQLNHVKNTVVNYLNETQGPLPWQVLYLNNTWIDISNLKVSLKLDNASSLKVNVQGIAVEPSIDPINATSFQLYRFFNLTKDIPPPGQGERLRVAVIGGTNSTHKVVLYNATGVPEPDTVLVDANNRPALMVWNNVTLSDLRELQFIIVAGAQAGGFMTEPEAVTPENPTVVNATEALGVLTITEISKEIAIVIYNVTEPVDVEPPPGTWKVLGTYMRIVVSEEPDEVSFTVRMDYTDEEVIAAEVDENTLTIYYWNDTLGDWEAVEPSYVSTDENYVWAVVDHFSIFAMMGNVPPTAVTLSTPTDITENSMSLTWTQNQDPDFVRYEIFQSTSPDALGTSIANITSQETTTHKVTGLSPGTTYYFTVRVLDNVGLYTDSSQVSATTELPIWMQTWFLATIAVVVVAVVAVAAVLMRRSAAATVTE